MRIYATADIHGKEKNLEALEDTIAQARPDALVIAGDIFNYFISRHAVGRLSGIDIPILGVRGNSDLKICENTIRKKTPVTLLGQTPYQLGGYNFLGVNGTVVLPFASKISFCETRRTTPAKKHITDKTILVAHPPPRGTRDRVGNRFAAGSSGLRSLIETHPPMLMLCGHIHEQAGFEYSGPVPVVNCAMNKKYRGAIIECTEDQPLQIEMLTR